jgi:putative addiction module component (TIGR02574 family)
MKTTARQEILAMPVSERLQLIEDIWDSIVCETADVPVSPEQREELDKRLIDFERDPAPGETWENVKSRIIRQK